MGARDSTRMPSPRGRAAMWVACGLMTLHVALVLHGASQHSCTMDEIVYPTSGYAYLTTGDYRMNPEHPPLLKLWTGASWLGLGVDVRRIAGWELGDQWTFGQGLLFGDDRPHRALLGRARAMVAVLSATVALTVFFVARRFAGDAAGLFALALYALDPLVIAHAGLATTDLGGMALFFLATLAFPGAVLRGGTLRAARAGVLLALALAAKFTSVLLVGVLGGVAALVLWKGERARGAPAWRPVLRRVAGVIAAGLAVLVASYGPAGPRAYLEGWAILDGHLAVGHQAYAFGSYSDSGWWWYFPAAWAVKTPIPILLASVAGVAVVVAQARRRPMRALILLLPPALTLYAAMSVSLDIGVRHLLPITPFLAVSGGLAAGWAWRRGLATRLAAIVLALWLAVGTGSVHPDEIAYANEAAGGPDELWRRLTDSNVDWGQDLPALADVIAGYPLRRLYLGHFGSADPAAYGLRYSWIPSVGPVPRRYEDGPDPSGREWIAIGVSVLSDVSTYGAANDGHEAYAWLRERPFTAFPGHSIALYDITGDGEAHLRLARTALALNEARAAEPAVRRAVELLPRDGDARLDLARVLAALDRLEEAAQACDDAERLMGTVATTDFCDRVRAASKDNGAGP
jgi:hypothetical protein